MSNLCKVATGAIRTASSSAGRAAPRATGPAAPPATGRVAPPTTGRVAPPATASSSTGRAAPPATSRVAPPAMISSSTGRVAPPATGRVALPAAASSSTGRPPSAPSSASLDDVARFLQGWRRHADQHYATQDQLAELMILLKEIKVQVTKTDVITRRDTILHFTAKVEEIYFDHASWGPNERKTVEAAGVAELRELHGGSPLSEEAQAWVNASLTPLLCTRRTELRIRLDQGLLSDFESLSPRLSLSEYKSMLSQDSARVDRLIRDAIRAAKENTHDDHLDDYNGPRHDARSIKWWCDWVKNGCSADAKGHNVCKFPSIEKKYGAVEKKGKNCKSTFATASTDDTLMMTGNDDTFTTTGNDDDTFTTTGNDDDTFVATNNDDDTFAATNNDDDTFAATNNDDDTFATTNNDDDTFATTNNDDDTFATTHDDTFATMNDNNDTFVTTNDDTFATSTGDAPMNSAQCGVTTRSEMRNMIKQLSHMQVVESAGSSLQQNPPQKKLTPAEKRRATIARKKAAAEAERKEAAAEAKRKKVKNTKRVTSTKGKRVAGDDDEEDRQMKSKKRRKSNDDSDNDDRLVRNKKNNKNNEESDNEDDDDHQGSDGLGNDRKKKKKKKRKTATPASVVARSKGPSPTDCWAVGLLECDVEDPYATALVKTTNPSIMKLVVRDDFFGKEQLRVKVLEQLEADNAEWSGATDREKALFLFFEGQRRWTVDGTPVYLGRC